MSDNVGKSYNEQILQSIIDGSQYVNENPYPSRIEQLLMQLKEVIEQGGGATVDQTYTPTSENAQSGKAVAEALETIPSVTVDQTYNAQSANAQSGTAVAQAISTKVDKVTGKGLSENDFTDTDKVKLDGIETGAEANVQADWTQTDTTADDYIKNKPTIPAAQVNADWNAVSGVAQILNKPTIPTVDQSYSASSTNAQSGTAVASAISGKISATDYATQNTGGTIKAWTTTDGSDTILHLATQ